MGVALYQVFDQVAGNTPQRVAQAYADVYGEYIVAWAVMLLLTSSRKAVDYRPVDRSKLNQVRSKKHKALLFDHTEVTLHINQQSLPANPACRSAISASRRASISFQDI